MDDCDCLEDIYRWVWLFTVHLWVGLLFLAFLWVGMTECGRVDKMVKPIFLSFNKLLLCCLFSFYLRVKFSHTEGTIFCREILPCLFAARICHRNLPWEPLPWELAEGIYRKYLPQELTVAICKWFFVFVSK